MFDQFGHQEGRVVVALLWPLLEFTGALEQFGDGRDAVGPEQRELEGPLVIPGKLETCRDAVNLLVITHRIELFDSVYPAIPAAGSGAWGPVCNVVLHQHGIVALSGRTQRP